MQHILLQNTNEEGQGSIEIDMLEIEQTAISESS
jgi:hypothetical protein